MYEAVQPLKDATFHLAFDSQRGILCRLMHQFSNFGILKASFGLCCI